MFEHTSRYYAIADATITTPAARTVVYKRWRFLPPAASLPLLTEVTVTQSEAFALITARTLGIPQQFWQVGDANNAMEPDDLNTTPGRTLCMPLPQP